MKKEDKINNKKSIIIFGSILALAILIIAIIFINPQEEENNSLPNVTNNQVFNTNENIVKDQEIDGLKFTNTSLSYSNGMSVLVTSVTNSQSIEYLLTEFKIIIKNEDGSIITELPGYVGDSISPNETINITSYSDLDLTNAYSIEYEVIS